MSKESPNDPERVVGMRSDLQRISNMVDSFQEDKPFTAAKKAQKENDILRELLTSYMSITEREYLTDERQQLNRLCRRILESEGV